MSEDRIRYSFIIPTRNRPHQLHHCLLSLSRLDFDTNDYEVIVVDDGSQPPISKSQYTDIPIRHSKIIHINHQGPAVARNQGAKIAQGQYLVFVDDDCEISASYLENLEHALQDHPSTLVGGRVINRLTNRPFSTASQVILNMAYRFYNPDPQSSRFLASNNMAVSRQMFLEAGAFNSGFHFASEDREFCDRWRFQGNKITYDSGIIVHHAHLLTFLKFCRQHFQYGRGAYLYQSIRKTRKSGTIRQDMRFHTRFFTLLKPELASLPIDKALRVLLILPVWQISYVSGYLYERFHSVLK